MCSLSSPKHRFKFGLTWGKKALYLLAYINGLTLKSKKKNYRTLRVKIVLPPPAEKNCGKIVLPFILVYQEITMHRFFPELSYLSR